VPIIKPGHRWYNKANRLWNNLKNSTGAELDDDSLDRAMFDVAFFLPEGMTPAELDRMREDLAIRLYQEYGFEFNDYFEWEDWRRWYEEQGGRSRLWSRSYGSPKSRGL